MITTGYMATVSGKRVDLLDPQPEQIDFQDIAHALARQARFAGHCYRHYSVADHCLKVASVLETRGYDHRVQLYGLLHDAAEYVLGDVPKPVKALVPTYRELEEQLLAAILKKAGLFFGVLPAAVHHADHDVLRAETLDLFPAANAQKLFEHLGERAPDIGPLSVRSVDVAEVAWLKRYEALRRKVVV